MLHNTSVYIILQKNSFLIKNVKTSPPFLTIFLTAD